MQEKLAPDGLDEDHAELEPSEECVEKTPDSAFEGDGIAEDPVQKMQRALQMREEKKGKATAEKKENSSPNSLGARAKSKCAMKKPASAKAKPKAKSAKEVSSKVNAKKAGYSGIYRVCIQKGFKLPFSSENFEKVNYTMEAKKEPRKKPAKKLKMTRACVYSRSYHHMKCCLAAEELLWHYIWCETNVCSIHVEGK